MSEITTAKKFSKLMTDTKPQVQEAQRTPGRLNTKNKTKQQKKNNKKSNKKLNVIISYSNGGILRMKGNLEISYREQRMFYT